MIVPSDIGDHATMIKIVVPPKHGAVLVDRVWNVLQMNEGAQRMLARFFPDTPPAPHIAGNVIRATLHPSALRPVLVNWVEVAVFTLERLDRECAMFPHDAERLKLRDEVRKYPGDRKSVV